MEIRCMTPNIFVLTFADRYAILWVFQKGTERKKNMSKRVYALYKVHDLIAVGDSPTMLVQWMVEMQMVDFAEEEGLEYYDTNEDHWDLISFDKLAEQLDIRPLDLLYEVIISGGITTDDYQYEFDFDYRIEEETVPYVSSLLF